MGLRINNNVFSLNAQRNLAAHTNRLGQSFSRLSTGLRITNAADDAAGLAISERLRAKTRSLEQASRNANDGISLVQTAEGALNEASTILTRMRELAVQSSNGTLSADDRTTLDQEFQDLISEITRIAESTSFNDVDLLNSTAGLSFQVGAGTTAGTDTINVTLSAATATDLGVSTVNISTASGASSAITAIDTAINSVSSIRGTFGSIQNRLNSTIANLDVSIENQTAAESRIRDVDVARETANLTKNTILQQAAISVLAQANLVPQSALSLLQ